MHKLRVVLKWSIISAILFFIGSNLADSYQEIKNYQFDIDILMLVASIPILFLAYLFPAISWMLIINQQGFGKIGVVDSYRIWFYSFMGRYVPGKIALVFIRTNLAKDYGLPVFVVTSVSLIEILYFLSVSSFFSIIPYLGESSAFFIPTVTLAIFAVTISLIFRSRSVMAWVTKCFPFINGIVPLKLKFSAVLRILLSYTFYWILTGLAFITFLSSFVRVNLSDTFKLISTLHLSYIAGMIAFFSPSGIGVREITLATMLQPFFGKDFSYMISVSTRIWSSLCECIILLCIYWGFRIGRRGKILSPK